METRGIRNNNPGNIRLTVPLTPWQGMTLAQPDKSFVTFKSAVYGMRALARVLLQYQDKHKLRTVQQIIRRWAPPNENDTTGYIKHVAHMTGFAADELLDLHRYEHMRPLMLAIIRHENAMQMPYTDSQIDKALVLAGIEPPEKTLQQSRTIKGAQISTAGVTAVAALEAVQDAQDQIAPLADLFDGMKWIFLGLIILGIFLTVYARLDDRRKGLR